MGFHGVFCEALTTEFFVNEDLGAHTGVMCLIYYN